MIDIVEKKISKVQIEIIKTVLYFDVFKYPLTINELFENSAITVSKHAFIEELDKLIEYDRLKKEDNFILNVTRNKNDILKRIQGNSEAEKMIPTALKYSRKIASFPFVEGVCLSGALSKNYYDEKGDIDFFIVTKPGKLWICRTLLILKFKTLPKNKKKYWCTNYFISSDNLKIPDNNAFTGTEIAHLIPTINYSLYENILKENSWYKTQFPNKKIFPNTFCTNGPKTLFKIIVEGFLNNKIGQIIDDLLLSITLKHWQKKYPELTQSDFDLQFRSRKTVCKRHTHGFQNKILTLWEEKKEEYEKTFDVNLNFQ